jgi:hypothetical protein
VARLGGWGGPVACLGIVLLAALALYATGRSPVSTLGFWLARKLPPWASVALGLTLELIALVAIRNDLTPNVLTLVWPVEAIRTWQAG